MALLVLPSGLGALTFADAGGAGRRAVHGRLCVRATRTERLSPVATTAMAVRRDLHLAGRQSQQGSRGPPRAVEGSRGRGGGELRGSATSREGMRARSSQEDYHASSRALRTRGRELLLTRLERKGGAGTAITSQGTETKRPKKKTSAESLKKTPRHGPVRLRSARSDFEERRDRK